MAHREARLRETLLRRVRDNRRDGASHLARVALDALAEYARRCEAVGSTEALRAELLALADDLAAARPSMQAIAGLVARWRTALMRFDGDAAALRAHAGAQARSVRQWADTATRQTVNTALERIGERRCVLTHSASATVAQVLLAAQTRDVRAVITESRPGDEGRPLATRLAEAGVPVTFITDAQAGVFVAGADLVMVGADAIVADGAVVNKVGTRLIALAAQAARVPFYACAESFKCRTRQHDVRELEELSPAELRAPKVPGLRARNVYFEVTPATLVTDWLSDVNLAERFRPDRQT